MWNLSLLRRKLFLWIEVVLVHTSTLQHFPVKLSFHNARYVKLGGG